MAGRVREPGKPLDLARLRRWGWTLFWALAGVAMIAWALGLHAPWS